MGKQDCDGKSHPSSIPVIKEDAGRAMLDLGLNIRLPSMVLEQILYSGF